MNATDIARGDFVQLNEEQKEAVRRGDVKIDTDDMQVLKEASARSRQQVRIVKMRLISKCACSHFKKGHFR